MNKSGKEKLNILKASKWIGTSSMILGAILVSLSPTLATMPLTFTTFLLGHIIWSIAGIVEKDGALFWLNFLLIFIDVYAIIIRIGF